MGEVFQADETETGFVVFLAQWRYDVAGDDGCTSRRIGEP